MAPFRAASKSGRYQRSTTREAAPVEGLNALVDF